MDLEGHDAAISLLVKHHTQKSMGLPVPMVMILGMEVVENVASWRVGHTEQGQIEARHLDVDTNKSCDESFL